MIVREFLASKDVPFKVVVHHQGNKHDEAIRMKYRDFHRLEHPLVTSFARRRGGRLHAAARLPRRIQATSTP